MYKQFKFFLWKKKKKIQRRTKWREKKKKEIVSELEHKFNISFFNLRLLAREENREQEAGFRISLATIFVVSVECRHDVFPKHPGKKTLEARMFSIFHGFLTGNF